MNQSLEAKIDMFSQLPYELRINILKQFLNNNLNTYDKLVFKVQNQQFSNLINLKNVDSSFPFDECAITSFFKSNKSQLVKLIEDENIIFGHVNLDFFKASDMLNFYLDSFKHIKVSDAQLMFFACPFILSNQIITFTIPPSSSERVAFPPQDERFYYNLVEAKYFTNFQLNVIFSFDLVDYYEYFLLFKKMSIYDPRNPPDDDSIAHLNSLFGIATPQNYKKSKCYKNINFYFNLNLTIDTQENISQIDGQNTRTRVDLDDIPNIYQTSDEFGFDINNITVNLEISLNTSNDNLDELKSRFEKFKPKIPFKNVKHICIYAPFDYWTDPSIITNHYQIQDFFPNVVTLIINDIEPSTFELVRDISSLRYLEKLFLSLYDDRFCLNDFKLSTNIKYVYITVDFESKKIMNVPNHIQELDIENTDFHAFFDKIFDFTRINLSNATSLQKLRIYHSEFQNSNIIYSNFDAIPNSLKTIDILPSLSMFTSTLVSSLGFDKFKGIYTNAKIEGKKFSFRPKIRKGAFRLTNIRYDNTIMHSD